MHLPCQAAFIAEHLSGAPSKAPAPSRQPSRDPAAPVNGKPGSGLGLKQLLASHQNALLEDERQLLTDAAALLKVMRRPVRSACDPDASWPGLILNI